MILYYITSKLGARARGSLVDVSGTWLLIKLIKFFVIFC